MNVMSEIPFQAISKCSVKVEKFLLKEIKEFNRDCRMNQKHFSMPPHKMKSLGDRANKFCSVLDITDMGNDLASDLVSKQPDVLVTLVYELLADMKEFESFDICELKNEMEAEEKFNEGINAFKRENDFMSTNYFTTCLALSYPDSCLSTLAFAKRSESLFRLKRYESCLFDVNRALGNETFLSSDMKDALISRKKTCIAQLKKEKTDLYHGEKVISQVVNEAGEEENHEPENEGDAFMTKPTTLSRSKKKRMQRFRKKMINEEMTNPNNEKKFPLPFIENPNKMIPNASTKININFTKDYGRHLVATEDINPGEILFVENPFASVLFPNFYYTTCRYCYVRCEALIPCPKCCLGTYCSESCRSKAFDEFHRVECPILYWLMKLEVTETTYLAFRLLLIATKQGANLSSMMQHPIYKLPMKTYYGPMDEGYFAESYNQVHNLMDNFSKMSSCDAFKKCYEMAVLLFLLKHTSFFGRSEGDTTEIDVDNVTESEVYAGTLLLKYLLITQCNSRPINDMLEQADHSYQNLVIGCGLYPFYSLMNHSCDPNSFTVNHKDSIVCYADRPIKKGDQIFTHYHWTYTELDRDQRKKRLNSEYFFDCRCQACEFEWTKELSRVNNRPRKISNGISEEELDAHEKKLETYALGRQVNTDEDFRFLTELISAYYSQVDLPLENVSNAKKWLNILLSKHGNIYRNDDIVYRELALLNEK